MLSVPIEFIAVWWLEVICRCQPKRRWHTRRLCIPISSTLTCRGWTIVSFQESDFVSLVDESLELEKEYCTQPFTFMHVWLRSLTHEYALCSKNTLLIFGNVIGVLKIIWLWLEVAYRCQPIRRWHIRCHCNPISFTLTCRGWTKVPFQESNLIVRLVDESLKLGKEHCLFIT